MSTFVRMLAIVALVPTFLLVPMAIQAKDDPQHLEQAKACTKECDSKHGSGMGKENKKYDKDAYEACMNKCMGEQGQRSSSPKK